jgi:acyl-CoA reductase-like NAD-dependent aldehyde dehydrogenase
MDKKNLVGPLIEQAAVDRMQSALASARELGYQVHGGDVIEGCYVKPAIVEATEQSRLVQTETFRTHFVCDEVHGTGTGHHRYRTTCHRG